MKNKKNKFKWLLLSLLVMGLFAAGCGKQEEKTVTPKQQTEKEQTEKEQSEIPDDLLPSGEKKEVNAQSKETQSGKDKTKEEVKSAKADKSESKTKTSQSKADTSKQEKPKKDVPAKDKTEKPKDKIQVKISIECKEAVKEGYTGPITLLAAKTLTLKKGATVYDALEAAGVAFSGAGGYVAGIKGVYEYDWGSESGWVYYVNGLKPSIGSSKYICADGDEIVWKYTTKL